MDVAVGVQISAQEQLHTSEETIEAIEGRDQLLSISILCVCLFKVSLRRLLSSPCPLAHSLIHPKHNPYANLKLKYFILVLMLKPFVVCSLVSSVQLNLASHSVFLQMSLNKTKNLSDV